MAYQRTTKRRTVRLTALASLFLAFGGTAHAAMIETSLLSLGGNIWQATFNVTNDLAADIEQFTIYFDVAEYQNLNVGATPSDWDAIVLQPDPLLPDDGIYDALALVSGIAPGASLGGFTVQFLFLGMGSPGPLPFDIVDPDTFAVIDSGSSAPTVVPLPATVWLLLSACGGLLLGRHRRRTATEA